MLHELTSKWVLVAGTGATSVPIIRALKARGLSVGVVGGKPDDVGHQIADRSHVLDYSESDAVAQTFDVFRYEFLVPTCNDESLISCSQVAADRELPGFDDFCTAKMLQDKRAFRAKLSELTEHIPRVLWSGRGEVPVDLSIRGSCIVKPSEASTGKGIQVVDSPESLHAAVDDAILFSRNGDVVIEEFFDGTLHSCSIFFSGGLPVAAFFVDEFCSDYEFAVNESNSPSRLDIKMRDTILNEIGSLFRSLDLVDGLFHTQVLVQGERFVIVESMRRCPGDFYGRLIEISTKYPYHDSYVLPYLGHSPTKRANQAEMPIARQTLTCPEEMFVDTISFNCVGRLREFASMCWSGKAAAPFPRDKQGIAFFEYDDEGCMFDEVGLLVQKNGVL